MTNITPLKIQTNLTQKVDKEPRLELPNEPAAGSSFSDHLVNSFESVAEVGHEAESISTTSTSTTDLAMAMDQFLVELDALKALVNETRKAVDRIFQESKA